jgi:hypothetical protein
MTRFKEVMLAEESEVDLVQNSYERVGLIHTSLMWGWAVRVSQEEEE